jgi:hypothetical protein
MTLEELPGLAPIVGAVITGLFTINVIFFKWLMGSFADVKLGIERNGLNTAKVQEGMSKMLDIHEAKDQTRHEENLYRFEKISVALARLGSTNGTKGTII